MRLNLSIFREELLEVLEAEHIIREPYELHLDYAIACERLPEHFSENVLYILDTVEEGDIAPGSASAVERASFLIIGDVPEVLENSNYLRLNKSAGLLTVHNRISILFYEYGEWDRFLEHVVEEGRPLREMAEYSVKRGFLKNPIWVQSAGYHLVFQYIPEPETRSEALEEYVNLGTFADDTILAPDVINMLLADRDFNNSYEGSVPTVTEGTFYGFRNLFYNIKINGVLVGRILFDEIVTPLTGRDQALIKVMGDYIRKTFEAQNSYSFDRPQKVDELLGDLIEQKLVVEERLQDFLDYYHWEQHDRYFCMLLRLNNQGSTMTALKSIAATMNVVIPYSTYTIYNKQLLFLLNLTAAGKSKKQQFSDIVPMMRDYLLMATTSVPFDDLRDLSYYYKQVIAVENIGLGKQNHDWYYHAETYALDYILRKCTEGVVSDLFIPEGLKMLAAHDAEKETDYVKLLALYLDNDRNIAETIRKAFIHRNTFLYRIKRIEEILDMNLEDPDVRLCLQLGLRLM